MLPPEPGPADHLRAYVDRATASARDPAGDPAATRVRVAMAGESPERFRDRLVLERAAWLARETGRPLRDIAAECGFRGYDVFVRAFRRELGASPSQWRADPTMWEVDAPGEVHFHPPDGIRLPARTSHDDTPSVSAAYVTAYSADPTVVPLDDV
ncbi:AraC family transcriptional regulator [Nocardioides oleivorans]|uniref:AraC family transcriptional regulator n=1 Tax=Nocardioides oleivorans TaxID=273676 RepID=A0A4V1RL87_9ACTN|nr:helix-turn-helix domain-containing protein [Nocardioides oleivorans]RYB94922.1 AraC family transcriptional regulator [Nocardioides oleivorans]